MVQVGVVARALHDKGLLRGRRCVRHAPDAERVEHAGAAGDQPMPAGRELGLGQRTVT